MLEKIREGSQGVIAKGILVLVIFSFAFTGVSSYLGSSTEIPAATVNGEEITKADLEQAFQSERARMEQQLGEMFQTLAADDNYLQSIKRSVLERLVSEKLVDQAAAKLGLTVSDSQIKEAIMTEPAFQTDGKFDNERYQAILRQLGYQPSSFRNMMRVDMTRRQLLNALVGSEFVLDSEARQLAELQGQTRDIRYAVVDTEPFLAMATVTEQQVKSYFDANLDQFISPEMVSLEYIELNVADLAKDVSVTDDEVKTYYDEHQNQYQTAEKRLAAHILVQAGDDEAAAKSKIDAIHAKLEQGSDFAELAKTESEDKFSGEQGGRLDWFEPGVMDPAFDSALFALEKDQYSAVVKSDFGFHIVKLLDLQAGAVANFDDVKGKILAQLQEKQAVDKFYGLQQKLSDTSYEVPDTLSEAAKAVGVEVKSTALFSRDSVPAELNNPELVKAAFSEQVMLNGMNSDLIELDTNHVVVIRVSKHQDAGTKPFIEVEQDIIARLKQEQAIEAARAKAEAHMTAIKAGNSDIELISKDKLARFGSDVDSSIVNKAFQMSAPAVAGAQSVETVAMANGYALVVLDKINAAENIDENLMNGFKQRLESQYSQADYTGVIASLKADAEVLYPQED